jgi:methanogenic corrinoid protein MtbC1
VLNFESGDRLRGAANLIAEATLERDYAQRPYLLDRYGQNGKTRYRQDILYDVAALAAAVDAGEAGIFLRYVAWLKIVLTRRGVASENITEKLSCMRSVLVDDAVGDQSIAASYLKTALQQLDSMSDAAASFIGSSKEHTVARRCLEALLGFDAAQARKTLESAIAAGMGLARIYNDVLPPLMREVGRLWQMNEIGVAHEHYCSAAVSSMLSGFYGRIFGSPAVSGPLMLVACVEGEHHELGARAVADVFALNGWRTNFLGANLPVRELVTLMKQPWCKPDLIVLSATMVAHLAKLASTITAIRAVSKAPIMIGGYLFHENPGLAARLGADGYADNPEAAMATANNLAARHA